MFKVESATIQQKITALETETGNWYIFDVLLLSVSKLHTPCTTWRKPNRQSTVSLSSPTKISLLQKKKRVVIIHKCGFSIIGPKAWLSTLNLDEQAQSQKIYTLAVLHIMLVIAIYFPGGALCLSVETTLLCISYNSHNILFHSLWSYWSHTAHTSSDLTRYWSGRTGREKARAK